MSWYRSNLRDLPWRHTDDPYCIWASEVMLQQTQVTTVIPYYERFLKAFPSVKALARADQQVVLKMWEGMGYYARARNFHKAARVVLEAYNGKIPEKFKPFLALPGVGEYIASAVMSIAFSLPHAVVDGNVKRVLSRLFLMAEPVNETKGYRVYKEQAQQLLDVSNPGDFNQAVMELGAMVCKPGTPACQSCPVKNVCLAFQDKKVKQFPKKIQKKRTPTYHIAAGVILKKDQLLITRRKPEGLLGGLWEFPGGKLKPKETAADACVREIHEETGIRVKIVKPIAVIKHAYTHFKIDMTVFICEYLSGRIRLKGPVDFRWVSEDELDNYAFPKANLKFFDSLKQALK